jgi:hypothetical protein
MRIQWGHLESGRKHGRHQPGLFMASNCMKRRAVCMNCTPFARAAEKTKTGAGKPGKTIAPN